MATFGERMIGAARLDVHAYEEVEADTTAFGQAMAVVALSSVAAGIGAAREAGVPGLLFGLTAALLGGFCGRGLRTSLARESFPRRKRMQIGGSCFGRPVSRQLRGLYVFWGSFPD